MCRELLTAWCSPTSPTIIDVPQISAFFGWGEGSNSLADPECRQPQSLTN